MPLPSLRSAAVQVASGIVLSALCLKLPSLPAPISGALLVGAGVFVLWRVPRASLGAIAGAVVIATGAVTLLGR